MPTDLVRVEKVARSESTSRADLEQMKVNALAKGELEAAHLVNEVLLERFPVQAKSSSGRTPTHASFQSRSEDFGSGKEAYVWLIEQFRLFRPLVLADYQAMHATRAKPIHGMRFAQSAGELFPSGSSRVGNSSFYASLVGGWFADTNVNHGDKFAALLKLSHICSLKYPTDWEFLPSGGTQELRAHQEAVVRARELLAELLGKHVV